MEILAQTDTLVRGLAGALGLRERAIGIYKREMERRETSRAQEIAENEARNAAFLKSEIKRVLGLDVEVLPGEEAVEIDGMWFRYQGGHVCLCQPCPSCGELEVGETIRNLSDLGMWLADPPPVETCWDCQQAQANANLATLKAAQREEDEPVTPGEILVAVLDSYIKDAISRAAE